MKIYRNMLVECLLYALLVGSERVGCASYMHYWLVRKRSGVVVYLSIIPDCKTFTYFGYITIIYIF